MPPDSGLDGLAQLLDAKLEVRNGDAIVPDRPGLGIDWNWDSVRSHAGV
jgi:L-alanine-DL-glutamate epimerase-like enolase superfamily enzyme